jgi:IS66 C-terminal element
MKMEQRCFANLQVLPDRASIDRASTPGVLWPSFAPALIGTAKLNDIDPESYLQHVLEKIADLPITRIHELLPWNFAKTQTDLA